METQRDQELPILKVKNVGQCIGCYSCMIACATAVHKDYSLIKSAITIKTSGGYQGRLVVDICRGCLEASCVKACPFEAIIPRKGGGIKYAIDKCTGCRKCVGACLVGAIKYDNTSGKVITCIQCGKCVTRCPHNVLAMEVR
ncbi:4Fe-4S dicluster domain-containing protein [Alkaliphilus transvaalensis]|uniref:4Fe-4S dicluster domain-containing protein n=1 Tax=Alkaliphilus transvaalensis TaxID=114628 RepID=UPI000551525A|nr:4Fe-4S dicluster domain-containing protein [Alkaliphilus transvaalensis]